MIALWSNVVVDEILSKSSGILRRVRRVPLLQPASRTNLSGFVSDAGYPGDLPK